MNQFNFGRYIKRYRFILQAIPRDGLQNESVSLDVATKVKLVHDLADAGLKTIEAGSFVSPKWVPQMAGSDEVFKQLAPSQATYTALTPNMRGRAYWGLGQYRLLG